MSDVDTREFERAMADLERESRFSNYDLVTSNARTLLKALAHNTPRRTGKGRAGWWPSWTGLEMAGSPGTSRSYGPEVIRKRTYHSEGEFIDSRRDAGEPSVEFRNFTWVDFRGRELYYLARSEERGPNAGWAQRAFDEAAWKFGGTYDKLFKRHSAKGAG